MDSSRGANRRNIEHWALDCLDDWATALWRFFLLGQAPRCFMILVAANSLNRLLFSFIILRVTCVIQWRLYCKNKWITYFAYCYITVGLYFVIATRLHYTVDVVLAVFITYSVWSLYIAMIDVVMEKEYFGLQRQNEKYLVFDNSASLNDIETKETITTAQDTSFAARRARLNKRMNRMRGAGIGYDRSEHDRVAFVPMQYNTWLTGAIRWCDGLDLRMRQSSTGAGDCTRWEELIVNHRSRTASSSNSSAHSHKGHDNQASYDDTPVMLESVHVASHSEIPASKAQ